MKLHLLDTNIIGYFLRGASPELHKRMVPALRRRRVAISVITRAEIRYGQALMDKNDTRHERIDLLLNDLPTLDWTSAAADRYGQIKGRLKRQGTPIGELDTQIAAQALAESLPLVTHNTRHFERIEGLKLLDWMA